LVWHNAYENNTRDIGSSFWLDTCWSQEIQVNQPDTELDFAPEVASGGGEVWCVWYGGPNDCTPYSVYASRWNPAIGAWDPEMQVSPENDNWNWWCHLAVDSLGTPHVVWCTYPLYTVFYSYYAKDSWSTPVPVNDPLRLRASPWADPHIVIDKTGMMHLSFTGAYRGASYRDIFYTRNDGTGWDTCQLVTRDSVYHESFSDIAADRPDNVWVVWDRVSEGPDESQIYASHYDDKEWSAEQRLDNDSAVRDMCPAVCLNQAGYPWVVWNGYIPTSGEQWTFCNRYSPVSVSEPLTGTGRGELALSVPSPVKDLLRLRYLVPAPMLANITVFDAAGRRVLKTAIHSERAGWETIELNQPLAPGVYLCQLTGAGYVVTQKFVVTGH